MRGRGRTIVGSEDASLIAGCGFSCNLGGDEPEDHDLVAWYRGQRLNPPERVVVIPAAAAARAHGETGAG